MLSATIPYREIIASQNFFFRNMAVECYESEGVIATAMGINNPFYNNVLETNITEEALDHTINKLEQFFARHDVAWTWLVFPFSNPQPLGKLLELRGMTAIEDFAVMGMDMTQPLPSISNKAVCIKEVLSSEDFDHWHLPEQEGFGGTEEQTRQFRRQTENIPYGNGTNFHHYVLYENNIPIAASTLSHYQGYARLDNIAVCPSHQNRGFGTAITHYMLNQAQRLGAEYCFLDASKHGMGMYKKLGFQEYYTGQLYGFLPT